MFEALLLLIIGGVLTLLSLIVGYYIVVEVVQAVRDLLQERSSKDRWQFDGFDAGIELEGMFESGDTGPLRRRAGDRKINPVRDSKPVRQLIEHLEGDSDSDD